VRPNDDADAWARRPREQPVAPTSRAAVLVPLDIELIEYAIAAQLLRKGQEEAINDRRFAESIYRAAVASGIMERVAYQDTIAEAG
jgi:hypothetical protein